MPDPMMAPMPRAVRLQGPKLFFSRCSGRSESEMSLSMDLRAKSWLPLRAEVEVGDDDCVAGESANGNP